MGIEQQEGYCDHISLIFNLQASCFIVGMDKVCQRFYRGTQRCLLTDD
jgi:hypothetical protein